MRPEVYVREISPQVEQMLKLATSLYESSEDFPAVNRNLKRILASIEMLKLNLEEATD